MSAARIIKPPPMSGGDRNYYAREIHKAEVMFANLLEQAQAAHAAADAARAQGIGARLRTRGDRDLDERACGRSGKTTAVASRRDAAHRRPWGEGRSLAPRVSASAAEPDLNGRVLSQLGHEHVKFLPSYHLRFRERNSVP